MRFIGKQLRDISSFGKCNVCDFKMGIHYCVPKMYWNTISKIYHTKLVSSQTVQSKYA